MKEVRHLNAMRSKTVLDSVVQFHLDTDTPFHPKTSIEDGSVSLSRSPLAFYKDLGSISTNLEVIRQVDSGFDEDGSPRIKYYICEELVHLFKGDTVYTG